MVHEATHYIDDLGNTVGSGIEMEKRAFFYERQFQKAIGMQSDHATIEDMLDFIYSAYKIN